MPTGPTLVRNSPGDLISVSGLNQFATEIERVTRLRGPGVVSTGAGVDLVPPLPDVVVARIGTSHGSGKYSWEEWYLNESGVSATRPDSRRKGTSTSFPAFEVNGNASVPEGTLVQLWPGRGFHWLFEYAATGSFSPVVTQVSWSSDQTDYALPGTTTELIIQSLDQARTLHSMVGGTNGRTVHLHNASNFDLFLDSGTGTSGNWFAIASGETARVSPGEGLTLTWTTAQDSWQIMDKPGFLVADSDGTPISVATDVLVCDETTGLVATKTADNEVALALQSGLYPVVTQVNWSASQTDYALPATTTDLVVQTLDAPRTLHSMVGGSNGRTVKLHNASNYDLFLDSGTGTAGNWFSIAAGETVRIQPGEGLVVTWMTTQAAWQLMDKPGVLVCDSSGTPVGVATDKVLFDETTGLVATKTADNEVTVTLNGPVSLTSDWYLFAQTLLFGGGSVTNLSIPSPTPILYLTASGDTSWYSIDAPTSNLWYFLYNASAYTITLVHDDGSTGTAVERFVGPGGANVGLEPGAWGYVWYDPNQSRWTASPVGGSSGGGSGVTSITAGTGLSGGTITTTGTIALAHLGLESLTDPNADRILFWDESSGGSGATNWLSLGAGLSISGTTLNSYSVADTVGDNLNAGNTDEWDPATGTWDDLNGTIIELLPNASGVVIRSMKDGTPPDGFRFGVLHKGNQYQVTFDHDYAGYIPGIRFLLPNLQDLILSPYQLQWFTYDSTLGAYVADGGTAIGLADPGTDALRGWDNSAGQEAYLSASDARTALGLGSIATLSSIDLTSNVTGVLPVANFTTGTPDGTKFVRDDGVLAVPAASVGNIIYLREEQTSGTDGGTFTSGAWRTRALNTEVLDTGSNCSLSSNAFTLDSGTYEIMAWGVGYAVSRHQMRLQNTSDATTTIIGANRYSFGGYEGGVATVVGRFTIASSKTFELQHRGETTSATYGFGVACSFGTEVYAEVWLRKVA